MIYVSSQQKVDEVLGTKSYKLKSAHHDVAHNKRVLNDILYVINDTINEYTDQVQYQKRKLN